MVVETGNDLLAFFINNFSFWADVLFKRMQLANINFSAWPERLKCFSENWLQIPNMFKYQAKCHQIKESGYKIPIISYIRLLIGNVS